LSVNIIFVLFDKNLTDLYIFRTRVVDGNENDAKNCLEANHILKVNEVLIQDLDVVNELVNPHIEINVTIRNLSDHDVQLSSGQAIFRTACCFNEKDISALLLPERSQLTDFFQNWDISRALTKRNEPKGQRSKSPSDHQEV
jgi:hypothetical protein